MREPRNPFKLLASEHIVSDSTFLRLFGPGVLEVLEEYDVWNSIQIFRSSPGGGKTSLFRLFTPQSLITLYDLRSVEEYKDLYLRLKSLGVITEEGPNTLGIYLSLARNYASLEDLHFQRVYKNRLFYALLNSRIILATLRSVLVLNRLSYPNDLSKIYINKPIGFDTPSTFPIPCSGDELNRWASSLEMRVCNAVDSFAPLQANQMTGHDIIYSLFLLIPETIYCENVRVADKLIIMLDDIHKLTSNQRRNLLNNLYDLRIPTGIWLAERLEALTAAEIISQGARIGRDYKEAIILEEYWRHKKALRFEKIISNIADRRAKLNPEVQIGSFESCLQSSLDGSEWRKKFLNSINVVSNRIDNKIVDTKQFDDWVQSIKNAYWTTPRESANAYRALEIKIDREAMKAQRRLFDLPIPAKELMIQEDSSLKAAAELFLFNEFKYPYYFGFSSLAKLASSNIEQFLTFSGELFEEVISAALLQHTTILAPERQEKILKKVVERRWNEIPTTIPNGHIVRRFLEAIGTLCFNETYRPNAPYAPGVTGVAITMDDRSKIINPKYHERHPEYLNLVETISTCISNNFIEPYLNIKQGGKTWMILYLNRLLCLYFGLPLQYGGWRPRTLGQLCLFVEKGYQPQLRRTR